MATVTVLDDLKPAVSPSPALRARAARNVQFDFLRIVFATLVLLSHAPEIIDGNRSREVFSRLTGTRMSFGEFAVDGFFLISGCFILQSWQRSPALKDYLPKRLLRIVPGYLVAVAVSLVVCGLVAPGVPRFFHGLGFPLFRSVMSLDIPVTPPVFPTNAHEHVINGSLWTIGYEFRCYLLVALLGVVGLLRSRVPWLVITAALMPTLFSEALRDQVTWTHALAVTGYPAYDLRLFPIFFVGGCFYLFKREIVFRPIVAAGCVVGLVVAAYFLPLHFEFFLVLFGSYLLFFFGSLQAKWLGWMHRVPDVSYGIYLYGWPVEMLLILCLGPRPWVVFGCSAVLCFGLGWLSWHYVERPMLKLKRRSSAPLPHA